MNKLFPIIALLLFSLTSMGQSSWNDYEYVLIPSKFKFLKQKDEHRLNSTIKIFFANKGFKVFLDDEALPDGFIDNNCNKIYVDLEENNTMFTTKIKLVGKDCKGTVLINSQEGTSREKEYRAAYNQALITALKSIQNIGYSYNGKKDPINDVKNSQDQKSVTAAPIEEIKNSNTVLTTESIENGYLIIDSETSTIVLKLLKTSVDGVFIASSKLKNGIVIQKDNSWVLEYYENNKLIAEKLNIKL